VGNLAHALPEASHPHSQALQSKSCTQLLPLQCVPAGQEKQATPFRPQALLDSLTTQAPEESQHPLAQFEGVQAGQSGGKAHCWAVWHQADPGNPHGFPQPSNPPQNPLQLCEKQLSVCVGIAFPMTLHPPRPTPDGSPSSNQELVAAAPEGQRGGPEPGKPVATFWQPPKGVFPTEGSSCASPQAIPQNGSSDEV
jgi:hypothetical protein